MSVEQQEGRYPDFCSRGGTRTSIIVLSGSPTARILHDTKLQCPRCEGQQDLGACHTSAPGLPVNAVPAGSWLLASCPGLHKNLAAGTGLCGTQNELLEPQESRGQGPTRMGEHIWDSLTNPGQPITMESVDRAEDGWPAV